MRALHSLTLLFSLPFTTIATYQALDVTECVALELTGADTVTCGVGCCREGDICPGAQPFLDDNWICCDPDVEMCDDSD